LHEPVEQLTRSSEGGNAIVSALTSSVPQSDDWGFDSIRHLDHFGDFLGVHFTHAAAVNAEILSKTINAAAFNRSVSSDDTISDGVVQEHSIVGCSVGYEGIDFDE
jgi:hypothetical protein